MFIYSNMFFFLLSSAAAVLVVQNPVKLSIAAIKISLATSFSFSFAPTKKTQFAASIVWR